MTIFDVLGVLVFPVLAVLCIGHLVRTRPRRDNSDLFKD